MIITIDGPTASGKSTVAYAVAKTLGFYYLPTGWLYRAVSYLLKKNYGYTDAMLANPAMEDLVCCLDPKRLVYSYDVSTGGKLSFDTIDITSFLKDYTIDNAVAIISPVVHVRELVAQAQRHFAQQHDSVIEGRDSGSVVFPQADYKFYLTASLPVRAARWQKDQEKRGNVFSLAQAEEQVEERDKKDRERAHSPLVVPRNAIEIDSSFLNLEETIQKFLGYIQQ